MTDFTQTIELQQLMETLGWWPDEIVHVSVKASPGFVYGYQDQFDANVPAFMFITDLDILAIITQRAEKELRERGWYPCDNWGCYCKKFMSDMTGFRDHSLADALRVEIERNK